MRLSNPKSPPIARKRDTGNNRNIGAASFNVRQSKNPPTENAGDSPLAGSMGDNESINTSMEMDGSKGPDNPDMKKGYSPGSMDGDMCMMHGKNCGGGLPDCDMYDMEMGSDMMEMEYS